MSRLLSLPAWLFVGLLSLAISAQALAQTVSGSATLIDIQGKAEYRATAGAAWQPAKANQVLTAGQAVRTGPHARAALLLTDRTQVRLNANTLIEIQAIGAAPRTAGQTKFRQLAGRAWVQSKTPPKDLQWETPTATAGIRGTDWEMEVAEDGRSLLSVFSGEVAFYNDLGRVVVGANQQAVVERGKAPVKLVVKNLRDRVQWVTAYQIDPVRHVSLDGRDLPSLRQALAENPSNPVIRGRILADLGRWNEAKAAFSAAPDDPEAQLGLAWVALRERDIETASARLDQAGAMGGDAIKAGEPWLYADIARMILAHDLDAADAALRDATRRQDLTQPAAWLLLAELRAYDGRHEAALDSVREGFVRFPGNSRLFAQAARLMLLDDSAPAAANAAEVAIAGDIASFEGWLVRGDIARREGDAATAQIAYDLAIAMKPDDDRGWYGRGVVMSEREYVKEGRADLARAVAINPDGPGYHGEVGTLESFANEYANSESAYRAALEANPADYVALTGLGVLELKRGRTQAALDALLKAGVMEPRYARAHVYTAVAYYQLGDVKQAREELARAAELDDKDPLPHFMTAMIGTDLFLPAEAIESARAALVRLPYLKSLNQLANDQQGSANLGQAFAFMGMEEWARSYAQASYSPFWAGSHMFLADRYNGLYTKNSELFQGFLADPTVFGASNRFQSLVQAPTRNLDLGLRYTRSEDLDGFSPQIQWSGYQAEAHPKAWYLGYERVDLDLFDRPFELDIFTAAFGIKPRHDLGLFAFADVSRESSAPTGQFGGFDYDLTDDLRTHRLDLGFHYRHSPVSLVWVKAGYFDSSEKTAGLLGGLDITARTDVELPEVGFRHSFEAEGGHQLSWGMDYAKRATDGFLDDPGFFLRDDYRIRETSTDFYASDVYRASPTLTLQADLFWQNHERHALDQPFITLFDPPLEAMPITEAQDIQQLSPRIGLIWQPDDQTRVRLAVQNWLRPSGFSSLGPVATAGIPLDDRLVQRGGELGRARLQGEWETGPRTFLSGFLDYKDIDNRRFSIRPFAIGELESLNKLRPRDYGQLMRDDQYEFADAPNYSGGTVRSAGFSVNHLLGRELGLMARYTLNDSENSADDSLDIPLLPRHTAAVGATWINPDGWYVAALLAWRSKRFQDEANTVELQDGVSGDLDVFWESRDKHWLLRFSANDLFESAQASQYTAEVNYRF